MAKTGEKSKKGNAHATNTHRRERKAAAHRSSLRDRMNPRSDKYRDEADASKAQRLYTNNPRYK